LETSEAAQIQRNALWRKTENTGVNFYRQSR
jgi:hypothetical protein